MQIELTILIPVYNEENLLEKFVKNLSKTLEHFNIKEKDNIIKFLKSDDQGMVRMGASMLKGILEE